MTLHTAAGGRTSAPMRKCFTGTIQWSWGLDDFGYGGTSSWGQSRVNAMARQITYNVLRNLTGKTTAQLP